MTTNLRWLHELGMHDLASVGGKNASLGEMISHLSNLGVSVPGGFATTAQAYRTFLSQNDLDKKIAQRLQALNIDDVDALAAAGREIRAWILETPLQTDLADEVSNAYHELLAQHNENISFAVRSSATAEDLPDASFAGQQETYLNIHGIEQLLQAIRQVFASLYNDRAIAYRVHNNFKHDEVALSAGVQKMVRSDIGASGVMFTLDTESGFKNVVLITAAYGLGEAVVQGAVNPDEFVVYKPGLAQGKQAIIKRTLGSKAIKMVYAENASKPEQRIKTVEVAAADRQRFCLTAQQTEELARQAVKIEQHYQRPMDIEWALDGNDQQLYILQARPETVKSRDDASQLQSYRMLQKSDVLISGRAIGQRIGSGKAKIITDIQHMSGIDAGDVLITDMTDPDWEPIMKKAAAIVTNRGGRTCHAAIIARELGIPAVVGCGDATTVLAAQSHVTVNCAEGETGFVYGGMLKYEVLSSDAGALPKLPVKIMMNVGNPERAFHFAAIPNAGIGLARLEFIINNMIGIHPKSLLNFQQQDADIKAEIERRMAGYDGPVQFFIDKLREGIGSLAAAFHPNPVIVRMSDFKSNEYANLLGGDRYEPSEENPMIGFRGASRYLSADFLDCFQLECQALRYVRNDMGLSNVEIMIPFTRTVDEAKNVIRLLGENGLQRGENGLRVIMMCEIPSNALLADQFLEHFDGFSIGSNDLTQLTLGLDRDSSLIAELFDERNDAVKTLISMAIQACHRHHKYIGICGQGPSDHEDLALWLLQQHIDSMSLNPDTVIKTWLHLAKSLQQ